MTDSHDDKNHKSKLNAATKLTHMGRNPKAQHGFVNTPPYRGSTVIIENARALETGQSEYTYGRIATPSSNALADMVAEIEGGTKGFVTGSGLSAITSSILSLIRAGDHILITDSVYKPTRHFADTVLKPMGIEVEYYDPLLGSEIEKLMRTNTRIVFTEAPGSQTFEMQDIPAISEIAHKYNAYVLMDNSWATPLYYNPFKHGVDVSIQAATKYLVGHADAMLGTITTNERASEHIKAGLYALGISAGSEELYLGLRGMRTLQVRLERHWKSGLEIANWLNERPEVSSIIHPAHESHPGHHIWKRDFTGATGLFSVILHPAPKEKVHAMLNGYRLIGMGWSWGGYESLVIPFDPGSYRTATKWTAEGPALRYHIGLEDIDDIKQDLEDGFKRLTS